MKRRCQLLLLVPFGILLLGSANDYVRAACDAPTPADGEQLTIFNNKMTRLNDHASLWPYPVTGVINSFSQILTKQFNCPPGSAVDRVIINITTRPVLWDRACAEEGKAGTYGWVVGIPPDIVNGVKTYTATNWVMLDPGVTRSDEDSGNQPCGVETDEALLYHELLHGQLQIDAMDTDAWQTKACSCNFGLNSEASDHSMIGPLEEFYADAIAHPSSYRVARPLPDDADENGDFDIDLGPWPKNPERAWFPFPDSLDPNVEPPPTLRVTKTADGHVHVKGRLHDKTKLGRFFVRIDPSGDCLVGGIEDALMVLPNSDTIPALSTPGLFGLAALLLAAGAQLILRRNHALL